jgi:choline dehydrogenase-like flavoprotein
MTTSLAYRNHEAAILRGDVPEKYTRLLPHIPGDRIIEFGSAEGVLALMLARQGKSVTAIEANPERHAAALALRDQWTQNGLIDGGEPCYVLGSAVIASLQINPGTFDTLVAVRMIYYLREDLDTVFAAVAEKIPNVVLCGNRNRAVRWHAGNPHEGLGEYNFYASAEGMRAVLTRHGYRIVDQVLDGDPIVVGRKDG